MYTVLAGHVLCAGFRLSVDSIADGACAFESIFVNLIINEVDASWICTYNEMCDS